MIIYLRKWWNVKGYFWLLQESKNVWESCWQLFSCIKTQKKCNKAVSTCLSAIQFVPDQYKTEEICEKAVDICPFVFDSAPDWYKT